MRIQAKFITAAIASAAVLGLAVPAQAVSTHHSTGNATGRCGNSVLGGGNFQPLCLFFVNNGTGAIWGKDGSVSNLAGYTFKSGSGTGSGQIVKNNATAMESEYFENRGGTVWVNSGFNGNYDWSYDGEGGALGYTWNNNAATQVGIGVG
ncbi:MULTISPECIES: hypothetical protein [unclassified Streptomyces]|uniref:hypothetical protein n=1 Tax=unclassified Streptomyces TaxID=2593676 RepID=UPI003322243F